MINSVESDRVNGHNATERVLSNAEVDKQAFKLIEEFKDVWPVQFITGRSYLGINDNGYPVWPLDNQHAEWLVEGDMRHKSFISSERVQQLEVQGTGADGRRHFISLLSRRSDMEESNPSAHIIHISKPIVGPSHTYHANTSLVLEEARKILMQLLPQKIK